MAISFPYKAKNELEKSGRTREPEHGEKELTCPNCHRTLPESEVERNLFVCSCGYHYRIGARKRIALVTDEGSFIEFDKDIEAHDPISFPGYQEKLEKAKKSSGEKEAVITGRATIGNLPFALFAMDPMFMMGSMGSVVGEKITRLFEYASDNELPVIGWTASGGARMQEGLISLMQMAKTSASVGKHSDKGLLFIVVLTDPTTGGVDASFAMEGDIILAEPGAIVGFAGKRVVEQTVKETLPSNFQTSEFLLAHGFVDSIVKRNEEERMLYELLVFHHKEES